MALIYKTYCIKCEKPADGCRCPDISGHINHSNRLRPPTSTKNKQKFRKFLDDYPTFPNLVEERQNEDFKAFLRRLKYFKPINGRDWIASEAP